MTSTAHTGTVPQNMQIEEEGHSNVRGYESSDFSAMEGEDEVRNSVLSICWLSKCLASLGKSYDRQEETEE